MEQLIKSLFDAFMDAYYKCHNKVDFTNKDFITKWEKSNSITLSKEVEKQLPELYNKWLKESNIDEFEKAFMKELHEYIKNSKPSTKLL